MHISNLIKGLLTDELIVFQDVLFFSPDMIALELHFVDKIEKL